MFTIFASNIISSKSLVIHHPHQVFKKNGVEHLLSDPTNREKYYDKIYQTLLNLGRFYNFYENPEIAKLLGLKL